MRFSVLALATSLISAAMAQSCYITAPVAATVWKAGTKSLTVSWTPNSPITATSFAIELYKGDPTHLTLVANLGQAPPTAKTLKVNIDANLPADWYTIRIGGDSYSHYFAIDSATGAAPKGPVPVPPAATTTAVAVKTSAVATTAATTGASTPTSAVKANAGNYLSASTGSMVVAAAGAVAAVAFAL
ncbi:hypothetical protein BGZ99_005248 [Dissophora globulifera]|uniref:Ser-Thr-rich glycosyl-phosphatidyl-inositol-anchored membrane family-domain-containing protein n=1 Tax=Dissophora globulifera TaxID=979702 RepID=A0A9P6RI48_9FUNG|nr:hypothetical protein BGZ99_005248 [Dissophora globulifera]